MGSDGLNGTLLIVSHGNDLEYLNIILNIYENEKSNYSEIRFFDLSLVLDGQDTFHRGFLKYAGIASPEEIVFGRLMELGNDVHRVEADRQLESTLKVPSHVLTGIEDSITSALISKTGDDVPKVTRWLRSKHSKYRNEAIIAFNSLLNHLMMNPQVTQVAVVNGRFPCQRGAIEASEIAGIPWRSYERGMYEGSLEPYLYCAERYVRAENYWYAPFPSWARIEKQEAILAMDLSPAQIHSQNVGDWFMSRRQSGGTNRFAEGWRSDLNHDSSKKLAVIFTSSIDEFAELGPSWKEAEWRDPWEAFEYVIPQLLQRNYRVVLRVHPNLVNKSTKTIKETKEALNYLSAKFPLLEIIGATAKTNSYALLERADLAIVFISTIGLEASQMGIRTICLQSSEYDLVADVKRWLKKSDVNFDVLENWKVDRTRALVFIAGLFALDHGAKQLLLTYGVDPNRYASGIALFSNKWAMRNTNKVKNLISIVLPLKHFIVLKKIYRYFKFKNQARTM